MGWGGGVGQKHRVDSYFIPYFPTYYAADVVFINHFTRADVHPLALTQTILRQERQYQEAGQIA